MYLKFTFKHLSPLVILVFLALSIFITSCQNGTKTQNIASEQINGYWTVDSICQFIDGNKDAYTTFIVNEDINYLNGMYCFYEPQKDCPISIYIIKESESDFEILRKDHASLKNDSIYRGEKCNELIYKQYWIMDENDRIVISDSTELTGNLASYYSKKDGDLSNLIKEEILKLLKVQLAS